MVMTDETDHSGGVILDGPFDPDAQATVTDYIDYTEYLPADIIRSLTLIHGLNDRYLDSAQDVHSLARSYGQLPNRVSEERPGPIALREGVSRRMDRAINARESAFAEACRLHEVVDRHFDRLSCIRQKLEALPKPPSREPTPLPEPPSKRRKDKKEVPATTRITLRLDNRGGNDKRKKSRSRRSGIGAEHLTDFNPDSPIASTEQSDEEIEMASPPKPTKPPKKEKPRRPSSGTGVSGSNALSQLKPPPDDAKVGSEHLPWLRLTEWEMTKLRKKMKKNAVWQPSEVMIQRELALAGRGWEAYKTAKALAEQTGSEFVDCDDIETTRKDEIDRVISAGQLSNRGMKLNEAKKLKRELQAREAAANGEEGVTPSKAVAGTSSLTPMSRSSRKRKRDEAAAAAAAVTEQPGLNMLPTPVAAAAPIVPGSSDPESQPKQLTETDAFIQSDVTSASKPLRKSSRGGTTTDAADVVETVDPIKVAPESPPAGIDAASQAHSPAGSRRSTRSVAQSAATPTPPVTRPSSRRSAAAASSIEHGGFGPFPSTGAAVGRDLRVKSATPARKTPVRESSRAPSVPGPNRRRKRPAPGPVSSGQDGGAAVSYGRRKAKPGKRRINLNNSQDIRVDEDGVVEEIDANEPRYCLCGDVSFGTMICCENQDCEYVWFHLECVGLSEVPSRTAKWYCPECRVKFDKGPDGIVKGTSRR